MSLDINFEDIDALEPLRRYDGVHRSDLHTLFACHLHRRAEELSERVVAGVPLPRNLQGRFSSGLAGGDLEAMHVAEIIECDMEGEALEFAGAWLQGDDNAGLADELGGDHRVYAHVRANVDHCHAF